MNLDSTISALERFKHRLERDKRNTRSESLRYDIAADIEVVASAIRLLQEPESGACAACAANAETIVGLRRLIEEERMLGAEAERRASGLQAAEERRLGLPVSVSTARLRPGPQAGMSRRRWLFVTGTAPELPRRLAMVVLRACCKELGASFVDAIDVRGQHPATSARMLAMAVMEALGWREALRVLTAASSCGHPVKSVEWASTRSRFSILFERLCDQLRIVVGHSGPVVAAGELEKLEAFYGA